MNNNFKNDTNISRLKRKIFYEIYNEVIKEAVILF
jgi:hypothetical protein